MNKKRKNILGIADQYLRNLRSLSKKLTHNESIELQYLIDIKSVVKLTLEEAKRYNFLVKKLSK